MRALRRHYLLEPAGGVEPAEAPAGYDHAPGHGVCCLPGTGLAVGALLHGGFGRSARGNDETPLDTSIAAVAPQIILVRSAGKETK